jgi:translocation protein SEC63
VVTPGAIVSFTIKLRLSPPGQVKQQSVTPQKRESALEEDEDGETSIEELIGRRKSGEDGEEPTPVAHAPHFPKNRKPTWSIFVGDHKLNRVFVAPHKFTDMGSKQVRTVRMSFQAPPGPGLYTFQVYCMSDSFVGADAQRDMKVSWTSASWHWRLRTRAEFTGPFRADES